MQATRDETRDDAVARHLADIIAVAHEAIVSIDENQSIVAFNRGAELAFGYRRREVLGRPLEILIPERYREIHREHVRGYLSSPDGERPMGHRGEIMGRRKDGRTFPAQASIYKSTTGASTIMTAVVLDLTSSRETEHRLEALLVERQRLARQLVEAQEEERRRIARELHDELGQSLTAISVNAALVRQGMADEHSSVGELADNIARTAGHASSMIRDLVGCLRPSSLDRLGLDGAVRQCVDRLALREANVEVSLSIDPRLEELSDALVVTIYRIIQESLTNVVRHAHARSVSVEAWLGESVPRWLSRHTGVEGEMPHLKAPDAPERMARIRVADDGRGISNSDRDTGLGAIRGRCEALGGKLYVRRVRPTGTQINVHLPVTRPERTETVGERQP